MSDQKKNKFVNISESEAKNPRHLNAIKNFNSKYSELIKEENLIKAAGDQNDLTMSGKTLICEHKDGILGLFFIYNNELLSFEYIPGHPFYLPGYQDIVVFQDIYTNFRNPQFEYYADEDFISIGFGMKIDRKNGDFYSQNPLEDLEMKVKGQCKTFKGDLYKLFEYFKKLSKKSEENKQKKLKENKF